ncbi:MAG: hypothetical protein U5J83_14235 [Bryobacterales bacterium]|nr:hypothetical protein [Bryobacterales bacterium]
MVSRTFLAKLPALDGMLGPVYTPLNRTTPRVVTALGAGHVALSIEEMRGCETLFVCAKPDETLRLLETARSECVLHGVDTVVLVESSALAVLPRDLYGLVTDLGGLSMFPNRQTPAFLVEGSLRFRRFCQMLLDVPISRLVVSKREARAMVDAGIFLAKEFCLPLLEATQAAFVAAGISRDQAREMGAELLKESIENAHFAGRKRWTGILHTQDQHRLGEMVHALHGENELLANLILGFSRQCLAAMGKDSGWTDGLHPGRVDHRDEAAPVVKRRSRGISASKA